MKENVLIISLQGLGNTVMLMPILKYLDKQNKKMITLVLSDNGSCQFIKSLNLKTVKKIYVWKEKEKTIQNIVQLTKQIKNEIFDVAYAAYPSAKRENTLLFLSRARKKNMLKCNKGFFKLWQFLNPTAKTADYTFHDIENNALLFGVPIFEINRKKTKLNFSSGEIVVGLHVGSKGLSKRWNIENYAELMHKLRDSYGCKFVVIVGKDEACLINAIKYKIPWNFDVLLGPAFEDLMTKISSLTLLVGNDSSIAHISALMDIPTIVIWSFAQFWRVCPYGEGNIVVKKDYKCIPCYDLITKGYVNDCQYHLRCIKDIKCEDVFEIVNRHITLLQDGKISCEGDFRDIHSFSEITTLRNGCLILSLKGNNEKRVI